MRTLGRLRGGPCHHLRTLAVPSRPQQPPADRRSHADVELVCRATERGQIGSLLTLKSRVCPCPVRWRFPKHGKDMAHDSRTLFPSRVGSSQYSSGASVGGWGLRLLGFSRFQIAIATQPSSAGHSGSCSLAKPGISACFSGCLKVFLLQSDSDSSYERASRFQQSFAITDVQNRVPYQPT